MKPGLVRLPKGYIVFCPESDRRVRSSKGWARVVMFTAFRVQYRPWDKPLGLLLMAYMLLQVVKGR